MYNIFPLIIWAVQKEYTYEPEWEIGVDVCRDDYSSLLSVSWKKVFYGQVISDFLRVFFSYVLTDSWLWQILSLQEFSFVWLTVFQMYSSWVTFSDQTHSGIFLWSLCCEYALLCNFDLLGGLRVLQTFLDITRKLSRCEGWRHWGTVCSRTRVSTGNGANLECGRVVQHSKSVDLPSKTLAHIKALNTSHFYRI